MSLTPIGDLGIALKADIDDYQKSMATASDTTRTITSLFSNLGTAVRNTGLAITAGSALIGGAMVGLATSAQRVSSAFREVDTISREVNDAQSEYGQLVSDLNTEFGLQANRIEVIDGLYQSISASVDEGAESQREFLTTAAQLAVVGRVDLATTVDVLSTVMNTYGMETEEAETVSQSLFQTVQFGKVRMEELAPVLGRVAALASELDTGIDEVGASMAVLTRTGFEARVAATGLRNIFRAMMRPSETMQEMLRGIALDQDFFADSMEEGSDVVRELASDYREATEALDEFETKQSEARETQEKSSLAIQEARLKIEAIEEERLDQLPDLTSEQVAEADSVEELESVIDDYQFKVNKARIEEEKFRQESADAEEQVKGLREEFKNEVDSAGNLEGSIGSLVLGNQNFIETLVDLRKRANEQNVAFNELFPRTRALQGALALVGEDGQALIEVFEQMENGTLDAREAWSNMDDSAKDNFESFEAFKESTEDVQQGDLQKWFNEATGEQAQMRNNISRLREVVQDLGNVFSEDVTNALEGFADSVSKISKFANNMDETMRSNISRFFMLATALGLVIGPLLLVVGQFIIIGSALGSALLPFLAVAAGLFGAVAGSIKTLLEGGEGASEMLNTMSSALSTLKSFLGDIYLAFRTLIFPELLIFGKTLFDLFGSIADNLSQFTSETGGLTGDIFNLADAIGETVMALNEWFVQNEELIVEGITALAAALLKILPNLVDLAAGILQVIININPAPFVAIGAALLSLAVGVSEIIGWIGKWLQRNDKAVASLITVIAVIGTFLVGVGKIAAGIGFLVAIIGPFIKLVLAIASAKGAWVASMAALVGIKTAILGLLPGVAAGISALSTVVGYAIIAFKGLVGIAATVAGAISLPMVVIGILIAALVALVTSAWIARDELKAIFGTIKDDFFSILGTLGDAITGKISWKTAGNRIVETLVSGMMERISLVKEGAKKVAGTVKDFLGFGSAPEGLGEEYNPENWGKNTSGSFASGIESSEGEVNTAVDSVVPSSEDFSIDFSEEDILSEDAASDMGALERSSISLGRDRPSSGSGSSRSMGGGKKVVIEEGAINVGPFHGISDEELPERVEEEVDRSLEDIIEEVKGSGHDSMERF